MTVTANPPRVGAFTSSDGSGNPGTWVPKSGAGSAYSGSVAPVGLMVSSDGSGNPGTWVPASSSSFGGNIGGNVTLTGATYANGVITPAAAQTTLVISNLPTNYNSLRLVCLGRTTAASPNSSMFVRFNGDGGANYDYGYMDGGNGVAPANGGSTGQIGIFAGLLPASTSPANFAGALYMDFPFYNNPTFYKAMQSLSQWNQTTAAGIWVGGLFWGGWRNVAPITSITVFTQDSGQFVTGTQFAFYGN